MFSAENNMVHMPIPPELKDLTIIEQQLISRIAPLIQGHMLQHGGIAANGHCVTFPQNVNEPATILPKLPTEIKVLRIRKIGANNTSKEFNVRRKFVQNALIWLKQNNQAYSDITISKERLNQLPEEGLINTDVIETSYHEPSDECPAPFQNDPGVGDGHSDSTVPLSHEPINIEQEVRKIVSEVVDPQAGPITSGRKYVCIPWPTL
ncbi:hypothetical protein ACF0H5_006524 [Mactra antiquata]